MIFTFRLFVEQKVVWVLFFVKSEKFYGISVKMIRLTIHQKENINLRNVSGNPAEKSHTLNEIDG